jgi:hypothetical protein
VALRPRRCFASDVGLASLPTAWCFSEDVIYCGRCAKIFAVWYRGYMISLAGEKNGKKKRYDFALAASTAVRT